MLAEPDFITVNQSIDPHKYNVVIMRWYRTEDEYRVLRASEALPEGAAKALAVSWSMALGGLEIR